MLIRRWSPRLVLLGLIAFSVAGCGDDGEPPQSSTTAPVSGGHEHIFLGSSEPGGGNLLGEFDFDNKVSTASFTECLGGSDDECTNGVAIYTATAPAFALVEPDTETPGHYTIADGTPISLEITAIDAAVQVRVADRFMNQVGESDLIGVIPFHGHGEFQVAVPGPTGSAAAHSQRDHEDEAEYHVSFRFTSTAPQYGPSEPYRLRLLPSAEEGHHHD